MTAWLGILSMVCFTLSYVPQLMKTYGTRNVQGISTAYWVMIVTGYLAGWFYVLPLQDLLLFLTYSVGFGCAVTMLVGCLVFRKSAGRA